MGTLGEIETVLVCLDVLWQCFGIYAVFGPPMLESTTECSDMNPLFSIVLLRLVTLWALLTGIGFLAIFATVMKFSRLRSKHDVEKYLNLWQRRIEYIFGKTQSIKQQGKKVMTDIAKEFADFFHDFEDDWSYTDIAVGLIMLKRDQKMVREAVAVRSIIPVGWKTPRLRRLSDIGDRWNHVRRKTFHHDAIESESPEESSTPKSPAKLTPKSSLYLEYSPFPIGSSVPSLFSPAADSATEQKQEEFPTSIALRTPPEVRKSAHVQIEIEPLKPSSEQDLPSTSPQVAPAEQVSLSAPNTTRPERRRFSLHEKRSISLNKSSPKSNQPASDKSPISADSPKRGKSPEEQPMFLNPKDRGWDMHPRFLGNNDNPNKLTAHDIWDILHFSHYAEIAYVNFDTFEALKDLVISTSKKNDLFHTPFMISYDHDWKCIVISIRGTYSAADFLVDLKFDLCQLDPELDPELLAHSGMLETAKNLFLQLEQQEVLSNYVSGRFQTYRVVVCGHSLGGVLLVTREWLRYLRISYAKKAMTLPFRMHMSHQVDS
jgi:hypothetical protein